MAEVRLTVLPGYSAIQQLSDALGVEQSPDLGRPGSFVQNLGLLGGWFPLHTRHVYISVQKQTGPAGEPQLKRDVVTLSAPV